MLYAVLILILVLSDQLSKFLTVRYLDEFESVQIINKVLDFTRVHNTGGPWSILNGTPYIFIIFTILVFVIGAIYLKKHPQKHLLSKISISMIAGGALGNFIDRIFRGYVVDMIDVNFFNYPVFNVADCYIVIGAILMSIYVLFIYKEDN